MWVSVYGLIINTANLGVPLQSGSVIIVSSSSSVFGPARCFHSGHVLFYHYKFFIPVFLISRSLFSNTSQNNQEKDKHNKNIR